MPWCKIVEVDGKQILFTNTDARDGRYKLNMSLRGEEFGGKPGVVILTLNNSLEPISFNELLVVATEESARHFVDTCVKPYLPRLQGVQ